MPRGPSPRPTKRARTDNAGQAIARARPGPSSSPGAVSTTDNNGSSRGSSPEDHTEGDRDGDGDEDEGARARSARSARAKRAWTTRRVRRAAGLSRAEDYIHIPDPPSHPPPLSTPLPTSDLLQSIHHHASSFFTAHGMLAEPARGGRKVGWGSQKRLALIRDAGVGAGRGESRADSQAGRASSHPEDADLVNAHGELVPAATSPRGPSPSPSPSPSQAASHAVSQVDNGVQKRGARGSYKLRDMYRSIQGEGLMALAVLVQEHVVKELFEMGYRVRTPEEGSGGEEEGGASASLSGDDGEEGEENEEE